MVNSAPRPELAARLRLQLVFRLVVAASLLAVVLALHLSGRSFTEEYQHGPLYGVIVVMFGAVLAGALILQGPASGRTLQQLAAGLTVADVLQTTVLVYLTGGAGSLFSFLFLLLILNAAATSTRRGVIITAAVCAIIYGALLELIFYELIPPYDPELGADLDGAAVGVRIAVGTFGFLLTAYLGSYLAEQLRATRQELAEQSVDLEQLRAINRLVFDNIQSGLLTVDEDLKITSINPSGERILGVKLVDVVGRALSDVLPNVRFGAVPDRDSSPREEELYRRTDGSQRILGFSSSPLRDESGETIGSVIAFQDLTNLREMEERLKRDERLASVGRLAAGIAHEIRNPLASISGSVQVLRSEVSPQGEDARLMDIVIKEVDRLNGLITEFLSFVRPERIRRVRVDLPELVRDTVLALKERPDLKRAEYQVDVQAGAEVSGDPEKLRQVLYNLLLNAAQAMPDGGKVTVRVREERTGAEDVEGLILLEVEDEGAGIASGELDRVFDPFFTTKEHGTGLGLALVHKIVDGHRGYIEVENRSPQGARFRVLLPRWVEGATEVHFDAGTRA